MPSVEVLLSKLDMRKAIEINFLKQEVLSIPEESWTDAVIGDGRKEGYQLPQTEYCIGLKSRKARLVVK